ncbi:glycosyltransferase [Novipirellula sp.]|uniref:glycosyltransferase n=1 Tax=Novipirellula sp. TaxID=2795430 RepID=UPI00356738FA
MRILLCHNYYQQAGGEDQSFAEEADLVARHGHSVVRYTLHNDAIKTMGKLEVASRTIFNRQSYRDLRRLIQREKPDVMHCTNTFPLISPAAYYAANRERVPVVQSLRNYRLMCPDAYLYRDNKPCELCVGKSFPWPAIKHRCYRGNRAATATVASMLTVHRLLGTYQRRVGMFYALTEFGRQKYIQGGLPEQKLAVMANFLDCDPGVGTGTGGYALFAGRLSPEKGLDTLLAAWRRMSPAIPLKIVGDGPMADAVQQAAAENPTITWLGRRPNQEILSLVGEASCLVFPSLWYEGLPRTIVEAFAKGTPVVASNLGAMAELIEHDRSGILFEPANPEALANCVSEESQRSDGWQRMRSAARQRYVDKHTAEICYDRLMEIYRQARENSRA